MFTIQNFEKKVGEPILQRGKQYYNNGNVLNIEDQGDNTWIAEVEGSATYSVEVKLKPGNAISEYSCDCPYDDSICKHVVAVFFAIGEEIKKNENKPEKSIAKGVFDKLLQKITLKEYQDFIRSYALKNKKFKTELELFFADKDDRIDVAKKYGELIKKIIGKYTERGFIDYRASIGLSREVNQLLDTRTVYLNKKNFNDGFALAISVLKEMMEVVTYCDDSNGSIGGSVSNAIELLKNIAVNKEAAIELKEKIFHFLSTELNNTLFFDYGDFGYELFDIFEDLAISLNKPETFLAFIDTQFPKLTGEYDDFKRNFFKREKINFLKALGKNEEADQLIGQNMDIVEVRQGEVDKAINKKDFLTAKKLIHEGIKLAEKKLHPGTVSQWEKQFLRIAILEKDTLTVRHYTRNFAFDNWQFSQEYYRQWKKTFPASEWTGIIEKYIEETINKITREHNKNKSGFRYQPNPPLLVSLAPVYIEEKYWDRLLKLLKEECTIGNLLRYQEYLVKQYPAELLELYLPAFEDMGNNANDRSDYAKLASNMKKVMKDIPVGKERIAALALKLQNTYYRRPAMVEELNKIFK